MVDGALALYLERGGKTALAFTDEGSLLEAAARSLAETARERRLETLTIEQVNGVFVHANVPTPSPLAAGASSGAAAPVGPLGRALRAAGFVESPKGLTLRSRGAHA